MWSRVGQRQSSCLCRACLHAPKTVARRSTTAATRRRKVTATDLFTACYTTILGTAAIIDAQNKESRKHDLDTKLEKARAAVNNLTAQNAALLSDEGSLSNYRNEDSRLNSNSISQLAKSSFYQQCSAIYGEQWRHFAPNLPRQDRLDWSTIEKAIAAEHHDPRVSLVEPGTHRGLHRATEAVITLVDELVAKVETQGGQECHQGGTTTTNVPAAQEQQLWQDMREARDKGQLPTFGFPSHDPEGSAKTRSSLRESFTMAIDGGTTHREMVAKICYNLLASTVPPSITIYNTLIAGFHRIQRPDLAESVVNCVLRNTAGPDTQQTTICLLSHFQSTENIDGVRRVAQRMRGLKGGVLYLNTLPKPSEDSHVSEMRHHHRTEMLPKVFVKTSPINKANYDALISAWLSAGNVDHAIRKFVECIRHNVQTDGRLVARLLEDCALSAEGRTARRLVKGIAKHVEIFLGMFKRLVLEVPAATALRMVDNFYRILEVSFDASVTEYGAKLERLLVFTTTLKPWVSAWRTQLQAQLAITESCEIVQSFSMDQPLPDLIDATLKSLTLNKSSLGDMAIWNRGAKLSAIQSELDTLQTKGAKLGAQIRASIIKHKTGLDFDPRGDLESPRWKERFRQLAIADALEQVTLQDTMTAEEVKGELVAKLPDPQQAEAFVIAGLGRHMGISNLTRFYGPGSRQLAHSRSKIEANVKGISKLAADIDTQIRVTKAVLYGALWGRSHRKLWWDYPHWNDIPLEILVDKHQRQCAKLLRLAQAPREAEEPLFDEDQLEAQPIPAMPSLQQAPRNKDLAPRGKGRWSKEVVKNQQRRASVAQRPQHLGPAPYEEMTGWGRLAATA